MSDLCLGWVSVLTSVLAFVYGTSSWLSITGLWMELPVLMMYLPEKWFLGAHLTLAIQLANLGPVLYGIARYYCPRRCTVVGANHAQFVVGFVSCLVLVFYWDSLATFTSGTQTSFALLTAAFGLSIVDCTSSVVYLPFMGRFHQKHMMWYLVGEGTGGFLAAFIALLQGATSIKLHSTINKENITELVQDERIHLNFGVETFFVLLTAILVLSWIAFAFLNWKWLFNSELITLRIPRKHTISTGEECEHQLGVILEKAYRKQSVMCDSRSDLSKSRTSLNKLSKVYMNRSQARQLWIDKDFLSLLAIQSCASTMTFGVLPAIQSFSCMPYGFKAMRYSVLLSGVAYPIGCFFAMGYMLRNRISLHVLDIIATLAAVYVIITASVSPNPPLKEHEFGQHFIVVLWTFIFLLFSYLKTTVTLLMGEIGGEEALFWAGAFTQVGSVLGGVTLFLITSYTTIFKDDVYS